VPVNIGESLRAGVGAFLADDHPHPIQPAAQVGQAGQLGHPRTRPYLAVGVIGRFLDAFRQGQDGVLHAGCDGHAHRVVQAVARAGQTWARIELFSGGGLARPQ
jgi:hypothetical protein